MQYRKDSGAIKKLFMGFLLRCPNCEQGHIGNGFLNIKTYCPVCNVHFERADGEQTGAMMITLSTMPFFSIMLFIVLYNTNPEMNLALLVGLPALMLTLSILLFYRHARGIWAAVVYLTGGLFTDDEWQAKQQPSREVL
ncbi:MAG: DUF983 domain-containing protein [Aggregatilineales bacterium]